MKKVIIMCLCLTMLLCACKKGSNENVISSFIDSVNSLKAYKLKGKLQIIGDEETFNYKVEAHYLKDNYYKVVLVNETNNHEQIILRNDDGIYVITPSLNKSFKFDSVWPDNSSQSYLLKSIAKDIENDSNAEFESVDEGYIIKSVVNYPNNPDLKYQKIYLNDDRQITKAEVYNNEDQIRITVNFDEIDLKPNLKPEDFKLENYIDSDTNSSCDKDTCEKKTGVLDDIVYPLYIPTNTYLTGKDEINNESVERVILTFTGEKNFVLIEENAQATEVFEIIPIYGDPLMINDTVGALSTNSIYWASKGRDYYLVSNDLTSSELLNIASSLSSSASVAATK